MGRIALWVVVGLVAVATGGAFAWRFRRRADPLSVEALGLLPKPGTADPDEVDRLRQNLRLKLLYDEAKIDRLIAAERERTPTASEVEWYRAAVERWERDNR